ncbi:MAG: hypothetical protein ACKV0T_31205 [Planctomycetales bacterium]
MFLPRRESRLIVLRHAGKLEHWRYGNSRALDVDVVPVADSGIHELCISDGFGLGCGVRLAFFEDTSAEPDGRVWGLGFRRDDEKLTAKLMDTLNQRLENIEELNR